MKREKTIYKHVAHGEIYNHYGLLFWQTCMFCQQEFRREWGYRFQLSYNANWDYACSECCYSKEHCNDKIAKYKKRMRACIKPPPLNP